MAQWFYPSCDIHLIIASGAGTPPPATADLRVMVRFPKGRLATWTDASTIAGMTTMFIQVRPSPATPGSVVHAIPNIIGDDRRDPTNPTLPPAALPTTISRSPVVGSSLHLAVSILGNQAGSREDGLIRVSTHDDIDALHSGDRTLSTFAGESNLVLTTYAHFTDRPAGVLEDVTGHPWLKYRIAPAGIATVDAEGRIHALQPGRATIGTFTWDDRFAVETELTVRPALTAGNLRGAVKIEELSRLTADRITTLYVLSEGYTDERRFFDHARKVVRTWLATRPYKRVANRFHSVAIFDASIDRGITIGSRLVAPPAGSPANTRGLWEGEGRPALPPEIAVTRDTVFGLMLGSRLSTPVPARAGTAGVAEANFVRPRDVARTIQPDDRRLPRFGVDAPNTFEPTSPELAFASFVRRYIEATGRHVGDDDRVAFLVDDDVYGGLHINVLDIPLEHFPMVALSIGRSALASGVVATGSLVDRAVTGPSLHADLVGSVLAHELAHSYHLGDEYENTRQRTHDQNERIVDELEHRYENIQHDQTLRLRTGTPADQHPLHPVNAGDPTSRLDVTRIKWNIHRVAKISPARTIAPVPAGFRLTLARGQAQRWRAGERAFIRNSLAVRRDVRVEPRTTAIAVQIVTANAAANTVDISVPPGSDLAALGTQPLLYLPKRNRAGQDLALIDPAVLAFLAANGPFPKGVPCVGPADPEHDNADRSCPEITGFSRPSVHADAIGLYEGGADQSCDIYRPAGRCKMRRFEGFELVDTTTNDPRKKFKPVIINFCFVCSYVLVDLIDPAQHEGLDGDYPRDC